MKAPSARLSTPAPSRVGLALLLTLTPMIHAQDLSYNTGTLGTSGDGTNTAGVVLNEPGALAAFGDFSSSYSSGNRTTVPFLPQLNPASSNPFTIEFWVRPTGSDNDDAPVANRIATGNRSGWVFFQRAAAVGWTFRMYNGVGGGVAWEVEGGTANLNEWSQVAAVWSGSAATLYVNGALADSSNLAGTSGSYNASTSAVFSVGALFDGTSPFNGSLDEVAFYPSALTASRISTHYNTKSSPVPGAYRAQVRSDGALVYLQQNPPFVTSETSGASSILTFTGILSQSTSLSAPAWMDLTVSSPYTVTPQPGTPKLFFRAHR